MSYSFDINSVFRFIANIFLLHDYYLTLYTNTDENFLNFIVLGSPFYFIEEMEL